MPFVRVHRPGSRDSFGLVCVANAAAGSNFLERSKECADISRGENRQFQGVDEQLSVHLFVPGERKGTRMEVSP